MENKINTLVEFFAPYRYNPTTGEIFRNDLPRNTAQPFRTPVGAVRRHVAVFYLATRDVGFLYFALNPSHEKASGYGVHIVDSSLPVPARYAVLNLQLPTELRVSAVYSTFGPKIRIPTRTTLSRLNTHIISGHKHALITMDREGYPIQPLRPFSDGLYRVTRDADGLAHFEPISPGDYRITADGTIQQLPTTTEDFL